MKKTFLIFFILIISLTACKKNTENIQADSLSEEYSMKTTWYYKEEQSDPCLEVSTIFFRSKFYMKILANALK